MARFCRSTVTASTAQATKYSFQTRKIEGMMNSGFRTSTASNIEMARKHIGR